jgi:hypothetical protein
MFIDELRIAIEATVLIKPLKPSNSLIVTRMSPAADVEPKVSAKE